MNLNQWFGIFVAVLMVGSIFGFAVYFNDGQPEETLENSSEPSVPSTVIQMKSENVEAKVVEVLPKILFSAYTNEADITIINEKLALVEGIYKLTPKYKQVENTSFGTSLVYIAEISFDEEKTSKEIVSQIDSLTEGLLFDPVYFEIVLVSVQKNVQFSNEQGFEKEYEFEDPLTVAYTAPGTKKGDQIFVRLDASFTGNNLVNLFASGTRNLSAEPKTHTFDVNKIVEEKLPRIVFGAYVKYSNFVEESELKEKILSLSNAVDVNVSAFKPENYFTVFFDANIDLKSDLNDFFSDNNSFESIAVYEAGNGFSAEVYFNESSDKNVAELFELISGFLESKTASNISLKESNSQVFASIALTSSDSMQTVNELNALFGELNFAGSQIQQEAVVSFDSFFSDEGQEFIPDKETVQEVFVSPETQTGETVELVVEIEVVRGSIVSIRAAAS